MLTADCVRFTRLAAAVKLPVSAIATKLRSSSGSRLCSMADPISWSDG